jgi:hypothetical protein
MDFCFWPMSRSDKVTPSGHPGALTQWGANLIALPHAGRAAVTGHRCLPEKKRKNNLGEFPKFLPLSKCQKSACAISLAPRKSRHRKKLVSTYQTNMTGNQTNMTDNQEHEEPPQCYTYFQKDGEAISVSKATHNSAYDVVRLTDGQRETAYPAY